MRIPCGTLGEVMTTYGLTKDNRHKFYIGVILFSLLIEYVAYTLWFNKIEVGEQWEFVVQLLLSLFSFSAIASFIIKIVDVLYIKFNKINGVYDIAIESSYKGKTVIDAKLEIKVGLRKAKIELRTATSRSNSKTVFIDNQDKDNYRIVYTYHNDGNCYNGNKLVKHEGTCVLTFRHKRFVEGYYYNGGERRTYGTLIIKGKQSK